MDNRIVIYRNAANCSRVTVPAGLKLLLPTPPDHGNAIIAIGFIMHNSIQFMVTILNRPTMYYNPLYTQGGLSCSAFIKN